MKQYHQWILNDTLFGDVFIVSHCFNARNVYLYIFKYFKIVKGKLGRKIHHSNLLYKNRNENPEKGHLVPLNGSVHTSMLCLLGLLKECCGGVSWRSQNSLGAGPTWSSRSGRHVSTRKHTEQSEKNVLALQNLTSTQKSLNFVTID